jgi:hypothetical protein
MCTVVTLRRANPGQEQRRAGANAAQCLFFPQAGGQGKNYFGTIGLTRILLLI